MTLITDLQKVLIIICKMLVKEATLFLFFPILISCQELDRDVRGLDSTAFKSMLEIGRLIKNLGSENIAKNFQGTYNYIVDNVTIFYFLILGIIVVQFLTFVLTLFALKDAEKRFTTPAASVCDCEFVTNDREYWPARKETCV